MTPGLSVIIDAIKESRQIFQRMNSYAIYRIAETIRVLLFMTLSILVFNFYPVTAVMIVLLALLNDGAILSIAYDRTRYSPKPEAWNMRQVLGVATVLGIFGVVASFGLFYLAERVFHLSQDMTQSLMYLKLSVAGHLTIFVTRTKGPFWSIRPARILLGAVLGTQIITAAITLLVANFFDLSSISTMGSAGFLLIFAAVNLANVRLAKQTASHPWISGLGVATCLGALLALLWQTATTSPRQVGLLRRADIVRAYRNAILCKLEQQHRRENLRLGRLSETELLEVPLSSGMFGVGRRIRDLDLPAQALITSVRRGKEVIIAHGETFLQPGDIIGVLTQQESADAVRQALAGEA
jgi:hypothetical protein